MVYQNESYQIMGESFEVDIGCEWIVTWFLV